MLERLFSSLDIFITAFFFLLGILHMSVYCIAFLVGCKGNFTLLQVGP